MSALARVVDVTPSAISQFESGDASPSPETIERMAEVLGVKPDALAAPPPPPIDLGACHFRHLRSAPVAEKRKIVALGRLLLEVYDHVGNLVDLPPTQVPRFSAQSLEHIDAIADNVRAQWGLGFGPLGNIAWLLENRGVAVLEIHGHSEKLDAFSAWTSRGPVIFVSNEKGSGSRRRFDLAHELAHLILHHEAAPGNKVLEDQADRFASAFLLPREPFYAECPRRLVWPYLIELKKRWRVSLQALVRRAYDLGIYSEATYRRANVQLNQRGWKRSEPEEPPMERPALLSEALRLLGSTGYSFRRLIEEIPAPSFEIRRMLQHAAA